ncbi:hypothetical protein QYH69_14575 [Paraburkholderia sp. SARCC-3016]|uniref:hypothetical protein n=1 Tax=Paraburkholderia sp. SARCC-3016 TaxID=3058611 RepID=UPI0028069F19|nr:hypothetical protein [Paraburkholderia sp. SARCC-3016]MDQ7978472.1 hypothetical protein [Paraburkholderia sp. SARCC-3016]
MCFLIQPLSRRVTNRLGLCAALLCAPLPHAAAAQCERIPVQPERVQVIGHDMLIDGIPTTVFDLQFTGSAHEVSDAFRAFWTREGVPAKARLESSGLLLSALDGPCHYVLQVAPVREGPHAKGLMSVMRLAGGDTTHHIPDAAIPLPPGATRVSDVESRDPGQSGRTSIVRVTGDAAQQARRYSDMLAAQGWSAIAIAPAYAVSGTANGADDGAIDGAQQVAGTAIAMQRGSDRIDAVFSGGSGNGATQAVIHLTRIR